MTIHVKSPGLLSTTQDAGRYRCAHVGISPAGAADPIALRIANRLVCNEESTAALEMTLVGATLEFSERCNVALAGGECDCKLSDKRVPMWEALAVPAGGVLTCGAIASGARTYLAVRGGLDVPSVLGSASTDLRGHFGGFEGRALKSGDVLRIGNAQARKPIQFMLGTKEKLYSQGPLRVTRSAQQDWFDREAYEQFFASGYRVSEESNRSGLRLQGAALEARKESQLLTEGVSLGAVQVPRNGQPIILFVDQQTTGGYPKLANVIAADLHRVGQLRPRDEVRFAEVTIPEAIQLLGEQEAWLERSFGPK